MCKLIFKYLERNTFKALLRYSINQMNNMRSFRNHILCFLLTGTALLYFSCTQAPEYPIEPVIKFESFGKTVLEQNGKDTTELVFSFTDGDGDLGDIDSLNIFITDLRSNFQEAGFRIPFIPPQGTGNGISGLVSFKLPSSCCTYPVGGPLACSPSEEFPFDTVRYSIYIRDRALNMSNVIETEDLVLLCN